MPTAWEELSKNCSVASVLEACGTKLLPQLNLRDSKHTKSRQLKKKKSSQHSTNEFPLPERGQNKSKPGKPRGS